MVETVARWYFGPLSGALVLTATWRISQSPGKKGVELLADVVDILLSSSSSSSFSEEDCHRLFLRGRLRFVLVLDSDKSLLLLLLLLFANKGVVSSSVENEDADTSGSVIFTVKSVSQSVQDRSTDEDM